MFAEPHQEGVFFLSALLTCESFGEVKKKSVYWAQHVALFVSPLYGHAICVLISPNVEESPGEKKQLCWCLKWNTVYSFSSSLSASSLSPFGKGGIKGLESQSKHWQWHLIIAVFRYVGPWLTCKRQGLQWNTHQGIWFLTKSEQLKW